jgi:hypothetical protein
MYRMKLLRISEGVREMDLEKGSPGKGIESSAL